MKLIIASSYVPFVTGGARHIVDWLAAKLRAQGHEVESFLLPFVDDPETMLAQIAGWRLIDLSDRCDRLICIRPPAYVLRHPHKLVWFIHHFRVFYDLWDTALCYLPHDARTLAVRRALMELDTEALGEAAQVYALSGTAQDRLRRFNGLETPILYQPLLEPERFRSGDHGDAVVLVARLEAYKRQHLLVEAMRHVKTGVRLHLCGASAEPEYTDQLKALIERHGLAGKVTLESRWIAEERKQEVIAGALAVANIAIDEDSFAYVSLEACYAEKPIITSTDAGGVLELVRDGVNGLVAEPTAQALAAAFDRLYLDRALAARMGKANRARIDEMGIGWDKVLHAMTA